MAVASREFLRPSEVMFQFLRHFTNRLKVTTLAAHLPIPGNLAPMQSAAEIKDSFLFEDAVEEGARELADSVNSIAEAAGASHISFEELDHPTYVDGWDLATDKETGVSIRWLRGVGSSGVISRFDVCYRLWKLLPGQGA